MTSPEIPSVDIVAPGTSWEAGSAIKEFQVGLARLGISSKVLNERGGDKKHVELVDDIRQRQTNGLVVINHSFDLDQDLAPDPPVVRAVEIAAGNRLQMFLSLAVMLDELGIGASQPEPQPIVFGIDPTTPDLTIIRDNLQLVGAT